MEIFDYDNLFDDLRERGCTPKWFGLGFIQVKVDENHRFHFWHPELTADVAPEDIHDHRYSFTSHILRGSMIHETFSMEYSMFADMERAYVSCDHENPGQVGEKLRCVVKPTGTYLLKAGSHYHLPQGQFHRVKADVCVTHVIRQPAAVQHARVIRPANQPHICPFAETIPEERLWKLMDECMAFGASFDYPEFIPGIHIP